MDQLISYNHLTLEQQRNATIGSMHQLLPNVFVIKVDKHQYRYGNMYIIVNETKKELFLIDAVRNESIFPVDKFRESGFRVKGIFITHKHIVEQAYGKLDKIAEDFDDAPIFMDTKDAGEFSEFVHSPYEKHDALSASKISVIAMPGHTEGSICIYHPANGGMVFTGDAAVGSPFEEDDYYFERPPNNDKKDQQLRQRWEKFNVPVKHILPLHGKPEFNLSEERLNEILENLRKNEKTQSL